LWAVVATWVYLCGIKWVKYGMGGCDSGVKGYWGREVVMA